MSRLQKHGCPPGHPAWPDSEREPSALQPCDVPEIIAIESDAVAETYARWVMAEVRTPD